MEKKSIFEIVDEAVVEGKLPKDFALPRNEDDMLWADGALDGVSIYHMGKKEVDGDAIEKISAGLHLASEEQFDEADKIIEDVTNQYRTICIIDTVQQFVIDHQTDLNLGTLFKFGFHLLLGSQDIESVKFGLTLLELFNIDENLKDTIRIIGLSDEFTIFSIFVVRKWENGQTEILNLAKNVEGWGRIHAVDFIKPESEEIREWLLKEGTNNSILPSYSGLTCYKKANVEALLDRPELSYDEVKGVLAIIEAMLDEGPVPGISALDNPEEILVKVLNHASKHLPLQPQDYEAVKNISDWLKENGEDNNPDIEGLVDAILCDSKQNEYTRKKQKSN